MFASFMVAFLLGVHQTAATGDCGALDIPTSSREERIEALRTCAATAAASPLDHLITLTGKLMPIDQRAEGYGDLLASWDQAELAKPEVAQRLLKMFESTDTPASARTIALRALAALPPDQRPVGTPTIQTLEIEIAAVPSGMAYDKKEFTVTAGTLVHLTLKNPDALEHNLLICSPGSLAEMGTAGDRMGQSADGKVKEFVPDSPKVLVVMGLVAPGKSKSMWFIAPAKPATYPYVCTYPSHWRTMNGKMKVTAAPGAPSTAAAPD
ncbi:MAG: plastocyanin/azurin family copper-binding protein [Planctomycetota bacterium]